MSLLSAFIKRLFMTNNLVAIQIRAIALQNLIFSKKIYFRKNFGL